jgi:hypothetical protein
MMTLKSETTVAHICDLCGVVIMQDETPKDWVCVNIIGTNGWQVKRHVCDGCAFIIWHQTEIHKYNKNANTKNHNRNV